MHMANCTDYRIVMSEGYASPAARTDRQISPRLSWMSSSCWRSIQSATRRRVGNRRTSTASSKIVTPRAIGFLPSI